MQDTRKIPVIVAVGESIDRDNTQEPRTLLVAAARRAAEQGCGLMARVDSIDVVSIISCRYLDIGGLLAEDLGLKPSRIQESDPGGEKPVRLICEAAQRIASGSSQVALICGAEALRTRAQAAKAAQPLEWGPLDVNAKPITALDFVTPHAARYGLVQPPHVYPLYENATRHEWKQSVADAEQESAELWSRYSDAAGRNPYAWLKKPLSPQTIKEDRPDNRMIAYPYRKLMVANPMVNQGAAVLLTSLHTALEAGVSNSAIVYMWGGARANEPKDFLRRDCFERSAAQDAVLKTTTRIFGGAARDIHLFEFYSCFPIVPKMARRTLDLDTDVKPSLTGGLTFFGGPANNFMTHAVAAGVNAIRAGEGRSALLYGQGEFVTKHAALILANSAPKQPFVFEDVQDLANMGMRAAPDLLEDYEGPVVIESFTVIYDRAGKALHAPVIARTPAGARVVAQVPGADAASISFLCSRDVDPIGTSGTIVRDLGELLRFTP